MSQTQVSEYKSEATFRAYTDKQGSAYAEARNKYHPAFFKRIIDHHTSTGGQLGTVVDVGCGPGTATEALASYFSVAIGVDASEGMLAVARSRGGLSAGGESIHFRQSTAEELDLGTDTVVDGSVDMITAATAAHWFDMSKFWPRASQLLKPGGTVALWTASHNEIHPSIPNSQAIKVAMDKIKDEELGPYFESGNQQVQDLYRDLALPWSHLTSTLRGEQASEGTEITSDFDQISFVRHEWGTSGNDDTETPGSEFLIDSPKAYTLDIAEKMIGTASPVTRWRQANPEKVGTEADVVKMMIAEVKRLLHEAGVPEGQEVLRAKITGVLLMIKKK